MSIFKKRAMTVRFTLDTPAGTFTESGTNTVDVTGVRMRATISAAMSTTMDALELEVWGMPLSVMNRLTILQNGYTQGIANQIALTAGDELNQSLVFQGQILTAWADFSAQPEGVLLVTAHAGMASAYKSVPPLSYKGSIDAATVANSIALQMVPPLTLVNSGVNAQIQDLYLPHDTLAQLRRLAEMADFEFSFDDPGFLAIWPRGQVRNTQTVQVDSSTGLVGFPSYNDRGISFTSLFNPSFRVNGPVNIASAASPASGLWFPLSVTHDLEVEIPGGRWYSHVEAQKFTNLTPEAAPPP